MPPSWLERQPEETRRRVRALARRFPELLVPPPLSVEDATLRARYFAELVRAEIRPAKPPPQPLPVEPPRAASESVHSEFQRHSVLHERYASISEPVRRAPRDGVRSVSPPWIPPGVHIEWEPRRPGPAARQSRPRAVTAPPRAI